MSPLGPGAAGQGGRRRRQDPLSPFPAPGSPRGARSLGGGTGLCRGAPPPPGNLRVLRRSLRGPLRGPRGLRYRLAGFGVPLPPGSAERAAALLRPYLGP